jgi:hypothetical protein
MERKLISRALDTVGNGTGTKNANGNYSGAAEEFLIAPDSGEDWVITRMVVSIEDTAGIQADEYGNLGAALTNGIKVEVHNSSGLLYSLTDPSLPVKTNAQWGVYCFDVDMKSWGTAPTDDLLLVRWTFAKSGQPIKLRSREGEKLVVTLNDNLTGLIAHYFVVQGYESEWI